jgi:hypothetical protein
MHASGFFHPNTTPSEKCISGYPQFQADSEFHFCPRNTISTIAVFTSIDSICDMVSTEHPKKEM